MDSGGQCRQSGHGRLTRRSHQIGDEAADSVAGADFTGRGAFGGQQRSVGEVGLVLLGIGHRNVYEQTGATLGGGNDRQWQAVCVRESGAGIAEQIGR